MEDILQIVLDKKSHRLVNYGEIQIGEDGFNMGFTIDGTKDSCKIKVFNYIAEPIEPYSIAYHPITQTWWVVSSDKVDRYYHEGSYLYIHTLQLEGAIELLNARDLTDSGFYGNQYTIGGFLQRLFALSNFDLTINIVSDGNIDLETKVDYLKTFENYTLGSAIREFLNGYNCSGKLAFNTENNVITSAILNIIPRTGNIALDIIDIEDFNQVRENQEMKKQNFATSVISNAENVVSTKAKTYPSVGTTRLKTNENYLVNLGGIVGTSQTKGNAKIMLPSPAYKVNWVKMYIPASVRVTFTQNIGGQDTHYYAVLNWNGLEIGDDFIEALKNDIEESVAGNIGEFVVDAAKQYIENNKSDITDKVSKMRTITFYGGAKLKPYLGNGRLTESDVVAPTDNPDFYIPKFQNALNNPTDANIVVLLDEESYNTLRYYRDGIMWKRGSNEITSFGGIGQRGDIGGTAQWSYIAGLQYTDYRNSDITIVANRLIGYQGTVPTYMKIEFYISQDLYHLNSGNYYSGVQFKVNYIPMSDIKIKQDNRQESRDVKLYNQNGKLTDSNAFSKQLLSYAKEVETKTITRFGVYNYPISSLPKIGQRVYDEENDQYYVIENISYDIYANEGGYFVSGTFELAPNIAVKSLLVNPNTNIRDYGIPQTNNVVRKQLYRDFYEIDTIDDNQEYNGYLGIDKLINFGNVKQSYKEHTALIKLTFSDDTNYYYQLDTTTYIMKKSVYEVVDFKDNNIIGYDCQSRHIAFSVQKLFSNNQWQSIVTPISYVDDNGKFRDISIFMADDKALVDGYDNYIGSDANAQNVYHKAVYINDGIYDSVRNQTNDNCFEIEEQNYNKDPLEVPFFEYSCQIDDGENVLVGEDILDEREEDISYAYGYAIVDKGTTTLLNATNNAENLIISNNATEINNYAKVSFVYNDYVESISSFRLGQIDNNPVILTDWYNVPANAINVRTYGLASIQYRISPNPQWRFVGMNIEYDSTNNRVRFVSDTITLPSGAFTIDFRGSVSYKYNFANDFNISVKLYRTSQFNVSNGSETLGTLHTEYNLSTFENKDLVILRYRFNKDLQTYSVEPTFVIKNLTEDNIVKTLLNTFDYIKLYVNYYKS